MIYLYKCEKCGREQEIQHKLNEKNEQKCVECGAEPEEMKRLINAHIEPNVSWSLWRAGNE